MSWYKVIWQAEAKDWTYGLLAPAQVAQVPAIERMILKPDAGYINVMLRSMRVPVSRKGWTTYCGATHCFTELRRKGSSTVNFHAVATPAKLKELDSSNLSRIEMGEARLLGPVPYRGGDVKIELGLFSVAGSNMAAPYLALLGRMASVAGVAFASSATPIAGAIREGLEALFGRPGDVSLEVGLVNTFSSIHTGYYVLARAPKGTFDPRKLKVDTDGRLMHADSPVTDVPYLVFSINASDQRDDFFDIPEVKTGYQAIQEALSGGNEVRAREAFTAFRLRTLMSPDLLQKDAQRIVDLVDEELKMLLPATATGGGKSKALSGLPNINLYPESSTASTIGTVTSADTVLLSDSEES